MGLIPAVIQGNSNVDHRGKISFINEFKMDDVKRFYTIENSDVNVIRGWRGHNVEQRWFHVILGAFQIKIVKIDNWETPDPKTPKEIYFLESSINNVLYVPSGYATSIQALEPNSKLIAFADSAIEFAENDNYLFATDYFGK